MSELPEYGPPAPVVRMTDGEIATLARDWVMGRIFVPETAEQIRLSFVVIALAAPWQLPANAGMVYEYLDKAGPRSINGLPCFFSVRFLAEEDVDRVAEKAIEIDAAIKEAMGDVMSNKSHAEREIDTVLRNWLKENGCRCRVDIEHTYSEMHRQDGVHPVDIVRVYHNEGCPTMNREDTAS